MVDIDKAGEGNSPDFFTSGFAGGDDGPCKWHRP
jgi:hypothetical protein